MSLIELGASALSTLSRGGGTVVERGVGYARDGTDRQRLDIYRPRGIAEPRATVLFFYGGGWVSGSRQMYEFVGQALSRRGVGVVIPDYRIADAATPRLALEDAALSLAFVHAHVAARPVVMGHSVGAHLAAALAYGADAAEGSDAVRAMVGLAGYYAYVGQLRAGPLPPALLLTAGRDRVVPAGETTALAARLVGRGVAVQRESFAQAGHATLLGALSPLLSDVGDVRGSIVRFIAAQKGTAG